jgi:hypothetical protein
MKSSVQQNCGLAAMQSTALGQNLARIAVSQVYQQDYVRLEGGRVVCNPGSGRNLKEVPLAESPEPAFVQTLCMTKASFRNLLEGFPRCLCPGYDRRGVQTPLA